MAETNTQGAPAAARSVLVIGMGNVLMQDEGIGVRAVELLDQQYELPDNVTLVDGGTTGMELFEPMRGCDCLIVADAVNASQPYGTLVRIANDEINAFFQTKLSNHQLGLSDLIALLRLKGEAPSHMAIIGMVPHSLENKLGLSPEAEAGLPAMVDMLISELRELGIEARPRSAAGVGHWQREADKEQGKG